MIWIKYIGGWLNGSEVSWQTPPKEGDVVKVRAPSASRYDVYRIENIAGGRLVAVWQSYEDVA